MNKKPTEPTAMNSLSDQRINMRPKAKIYIIYATEIIHCLFTFHNIANPLFDEITN